MALIFLFFLSGIIIATMLIAKRFEEKRKTRVFFLKLLKHGDERARDSYHKSLHYYSLGKERSAFLLQKLLPLKTKSYWNKFQTAIKQAAEEYAGDIRNSRLLRRSDGISEFFKSISDIEKGSGEIHENFSGGEINEVLDKPKKRTYNRKKVKVN